MSKVEERLAAASLTLPEPPTPLGNYVGAKTVGKLVYLSGHGPREADGSYITGKVPSVCSADAAYDAARLVGVNCLASLKAEIGDLDRVTRVVKILCMVNCTPDFGQQPAVANGASDLLVEVFGEIGKHSRSAVGMTALPGNACVEVEAIVEISP